MKLGPGHAVDLDAGQLRDVFSGVFISCGSSLGKGADSDQAMNGLTTARTWAIVIGLANAPSGVGLFLSTRLSVAA